MQEIMAFFVLKVVQSYGTKIGAVGIRGCSDFDCRW